MRTLTVAAAGWVRERLLLGAAERAAARCAPEQREAVAGALSSARRHQEAARELSRPRHVASARILYRAAVADYVAAARLAGGEAEREREAAEQALAELDAADIDGIAFREAHALLARVDRAAEQLGRLVEPRPVAAIRRARALRLGAAALATGLVAALVVAAWRAPRNVALRRPVSASSALYGSPGAVVNGSIEWGSFGLHTRSDRPAWVVIDLEHACAIDEIRLYNRGDGWLDEAVNARIELSDDGRAYRPAATCRELFTQATPCRLPLFGGRARYVKIVHPVYLALSEVEVLGKP